MSEKKKEILKECELLGTINVVAGNQECITYYLSNMTTT